MAHRGLKALSAESAVELANRSATGKALATVVLGLPSPEQGEDDDSPNVALGYLVYVRQGGFLVVLPVTEEIRNCLDAHGLQVGSAPAYKSGELDIETPRGRILGRESVDLVDLSWAFIGLFAGAAALRAFRGPRIQQFKVEGEMGRPSKKSACELANEWISSVMPQDIAQEYLTGEEFMEDAVDEEELQEDVPQGASTQDQESAALRARVKELEDVIKGKMAPPPVQACGATAKPAGKAPPLIPNPQTGQLGPADWVRLQRLAGPPPRAGAAETRRPAPTAANQAADDMMHMLEQEAEAVAPAEEAINAVIGQGGDPIQQLLFAQLRQNQVLLEKLTAPKHADPLVNMLDGSGSASGSGGGSGVRGCIARDTYVRTMLDVSKLAEVFEQNAAKELGLAPERVDSSLMLKYVERRLPVSESRLMTYLAFLMADAWALGHGSNNHELMGVAGKVLMFLEQASLDQGRLQLAWLLTGRQDPPFNILQSNKKKTGLFPFSKLAAAPWIAANLAFVKDIDMLESKTLAMRKDTKPNAEGEEDAEPKPKRPPKNPKAKWKSKGAEESTSTS